VLVGGLVIGMHFLHVGRERETLPYRLIRTHKGMRAEAKKKKGKHF
jgi:hypothetical protein